MKEADSMSMTMNARYYINVQFAPGSLMVSENIKPDNEIWSLGSASHEK